jgi:hypothetical protein
MKHLSLKLVVDPVPESPHVDVFLRTVSAGENTSAGFVRQPMALEPSPIG